MRNLSKPSHLCQYAAQTPSLACTSYINRATQTQLKMFEGRCERIGGGKAGCSGLGWAGYIGCARERIKRYMKGVMFSFSLAPVS